MTFQRSLNIAKSWDGKHLPASEQAQLRLVGNSQQLSVEFNAPFRGDAPPPLPLGSTWALWEYEVLELFLVGASGTYLELEFGPHGHYLALLLERPREIVSKHLPLHYRATCADQRWYGKATISTKYVPHRIERWNGFSIHGQGERRRYHAHCEVPGHLPDFHQPHAFPLF